MKRNGSILLALIMIFNILISGVSSSLAYAEDNTAYTQELSSEKELTKVEQTNKEEPSEKTEEKSVEKTILLTEESKDNLLQDTNQEKIDDEKEQSLEESKRIQDSKEESGLIVKVDAPKGAFPSGTRLSDNGVHNSIGFHLFGVCNG